MSRFQITVPASTANIGPGFDSAGIALSRYLTLEVETSDEWAFEHRSVHLPEVTNYKDHFIYQMAKKTADLYNKELPPVHITMFSDIPLARGLGSSSSAIIAAIELVNQLCELSLSREEKLRIAARFEGHPDNVAPCVLGGIVVAAQFDDGELDYYHQLESDVDLVVYIPQFELKTEDARKALPADYSRTLATRASAVANVMFTALLAGNYELAGKMMEKDLFHEPYRASLLPEYEQIRSDARTAGAYGTVISGAGPTMMSLVPKGKGKSVAQTLQSKLENYEVAALDVDIKGAFTEVLS